MTLPTRPLTPTLDAIANGTAAAEIAARDAYDAAILASNQPTPAPAPAPVPPPVAAPPAPTPVPVPAPPAPPSGLTTLWAEDFTRYTSQGDFLARFGRDASKHLEISSGPTGDVRLETINGVPGMGLHWSGGGVGPTPTFSPRFDPPPVFSQVSVKLSDTYSPGFVIPAEYKAFLLKLGPNTSAGMPQIGVYLESGVVTKVKMDVTDRTPTGNINTGSPLPGTTTNTVIHTFALPSGWQGSRLDWEIKASGLGSASATFELWLNGALIIGPLVGSFCPGATIGGLPQVLIIEPGSNINAFPVAAQSRWISNISVATAP